MAPVPRCRRGRATPHAAVAPWGYGGRVVAHLLPPSVPFPFPPQIPDRDTVRPPELPRYGRGRRARDSPSLEFPGTNKRRQHLRLDLFPLPTGGIGLGSPETTPASSTSSGAGRRSSSSLRALAVLSAPRRTDHTRELTGELATFLPSPSPPFSLSRRRFLVAVAAGVPALVPGLGSGLSRP